MIRTPQDPGCGPDDDIAWQTLLQRAHHAPSADAREAKPPSMFEQLYGPIACARSLVLGQLGQSLDGRIATETGHSHYLNGPEGLLHLHRLRALVHAVVVGVGTVLADDPLLTVRRASGPSPVRVVIDPNGRMPHDARMLTDSAARTLLVQQVGGRAPAGVESLHLPQLGGQFQPQNIIGALAVRGLTRLLIEGGARTLSTFLAAGALHRLHVCVAPLLIGSGLPSLTLPPIARLDEAARPPAAIYRLGADVLFDLDLR